MRTLVIALALLGFSTIAQAATIRDAFDLTQNIGAATTLRCSKETPEDTASLIARQECRSIDMAVDAFNEKLTQFTSRLVQQCIVDIKAGQGIKNCQATIDNYLMVVLIGDEEQAYLALKAQYEALLRNLPVLR